jgi:tape measure domain-containing protein
MGSVGTTYSIAGIENRFGALPQTTAAFSQRLSELRERLDNTIQGTQTYINVAVAMADAQRQAQATTQGLGVALAAQLRTGEVASSQRNLQAAIGQLRNEMLELDTTTREGASTYAANANQVRELERQLRTLASAYTHVSDAANRATSAQSTAASRLVTANYLNRGAVSAREQAFGTAAQQIVQTAAATPLLLPAAGQTSAPGTGMTYSGGARVRLGAGRPGMARLAELSPEAARGAYRGGYSEAAYIAELQANAAGIPRREAGLRSPADASGLSVERNRRALRDIYSDITKATQAGNNSIASLQKQQNLWNELRSAVSSNSPAFKTATREIDAVDRRLERINRSRGRLSGMQLAQAGGAAISGGIFGGPEGFLGGAIGGAVGGVGGAFAGAAIGAQVGMVRQSIGEMTAYAAEIRKQRIAIQGVVSSFEDYRTAIQTTEAVANRFNIPLKDSTQQFTRLAAAVIGSGGTIEEARTSFNGITAAILATGGGAEQANAALTATVQVFSKGKTSAEELLQIGERLPGTYSLFADSMGKSTSELSKLLQQGKVGLPEFSKFLADIGIKFGGTADKMAASSEQAGARMERAFEDLRITIGNALGPAGATFQDFATGAIKNVDALIERLIKLRVVTPGPNYFVNEVVSGRMSMEELQTRRTELTSSQSQAKQRASNPAVGAFQGLASAAASPLGRFISPMFGAGALGGVLSMFGRPTGQVNQELKSVNESIDKLDVLRQNTERDDANARRDAKAAEDAAKAKERENQAKQLLDLIDQREEQLAEARTNREEQLAEIRKNAIRKAADLERSFADDRLRIERDIRDIRTRSADTSVDNALRLREAMGEDKSIIEAEREVVEIFRRERDTLRTEADRRADEERTQARTIADFQREVSESINKANETYAKRIGEIQTNFAKQSGKLIEEASGRGAQRLVIAGKILALYTTRGTDLTLPVGSRGNEPLYGGKGGYEPRTGTYMISKIPSVQSTVETDRQILALSRQAARVAGTPSVSLAPAAPTTARPTYSTPALPGAAATTEARTRRGEATTEAAGRATREELAIGFANDVTALTNLKDKLDDDLQRLRGTATLEVRGYTSEVARSLVDINMQSSDAARALFSTLQSSMADYPDRQEELLNIYDEQSERLDKTYADLRNITIELANQNALLEARQDMRVGEGLTDGIREYTQSLGTLREATQQLAGTGLKGIESAIIDLSTTGTTAFREFANSIIKDTIRIITQQLIMRSVLSIFGLGGPKLMPGLGGSSGLAGFSAGNVGFDASGVGSFTGTLGSFSAGGIAQGPTSGYPATLHGNEAVIPLSGSRSIPVEMRGGSAGTTNIVINVEAGTASAEGPDSAAGQDLARDLARVVDDRLVYHRRPGGLLSGSR